MRLVEEQKRAPNGIWRTISYDLETAHGRAVYIARTRYAFPGGYELIALTNDGALLCSQCVRDNLREILESARDGESSRDGWFIEAIENSSNLECYETCEHCGNAIDGYHEQSEDKVYTYAD